MHKISKIMLKLITIWLIILVIDIVCIKEINRPFFMIRTSTLKDGGTKIYYGLGYKVIDYNVIDGYQGINIGSYFMKYNPSKYEMGKSLSIMVISSTVDAKGINISLDKATTSTLSYTIKNDSDKDLILPVDFYIEVFEKNNWYTYNIKNLWFQDETTIIKAFESKKGNINFTNYGYSKLKKGKYRLVKKIDDYYLASEFDIK